MYVLILGDHNGRVEYWKSHTLDPEGFTLFFEDDTEQEYHAAEQPGIYGKNNAIIHEYDGEMYGVASRREGLQDRSKVTWLKINTDMDTVETGGASRRIGTDLIGTDKLYMYRTREYHMYCGVGTGDASMLPYYSKTTGQYTMYCAEVSTGPDNILWFDQVSR